MNHGMLPSLSGWGGEQQGNALRASPEQGVPGRSGKGLAQQGKAL